MRNVIKRAHVTVGETERRREAAVPAPRPARGVRIVRLATDRYAFECTCSCGETMVVEVETDASPQEES